MAQHLQVGNSTAHLQLIDAINFRLATRSPEKKALPTI